MFADASSIERIFSKIDRDELVQLVMSLASFNSPTGCEQEIAQFVLNWFAKNGFNTIKQEVENGRFNAVGVLRGTESGPSLTIDGHLDIVYQEPLVDKPYVSDGLVYGHEIENQRAGIGSFMIAAKAIKEAGVKLKGDLILATVVGEVGPSPVGEFQGPQDRAESYGTWHLLTHGIQTDYALVTDGSDFAIVRAQAGAVYVKITTKGVFAYSPYTKRSTKVEESQNAIIKMTEVIDKIENWAQDWEQKHIYEFPGGRVEPKVSINKIQAGMPKFVDGEWRGPFDPMMSPRSCDLYVDVRTPPGMSPVEIKHELEALLSKLPFECELEMFRAQKGYEGKGPEIDYLSSTVEGAYEYVHQSKPPPAAPGESSMWTNTNIYWELGIPAVKWGPSDHVKYPGRTRVEIDGLVRAAKTYSLVALEVCGQANK